MLKAPHLSRVSPELGLSFNHSSYGLLQLRSSLNTLSQGCMLFSWWWHAAEKQICHLHFKFQFQHIVLACKLRSVDENDVFSTIQGSRSEETHSLNCSKRTLCSSIACLISAEKQPALSLNTDSLTKAHSSYLNKKHVSRNPQKIRLLCAFLPQTAKHSHLTFKAYPSTVSRFIALFLIILSLQFFF